MHMIDMIACPHGVIKQILENSHLLTVTTTTVQQRAYKERVANLAPVADWLSRSWPKIGPVEAKM